MLASNKWIRVRFGLRSWAFLIEAAQIVMGVVKIRREANRTLQQFDGVFQLPSFLLVYRFFIFLDGFLRKVLLHLADVDHIAIFGIQSREAGARIRSRFTEKDRDVRGAEVVEHLDLLPRRFITVG